MVELVVRCNAPQITNNNVMDEWHVGKITGSYA